MKQKKVFFKAGILLLSLLLLPGLAGCGAISGPAPVTPEEITAPAIAEEVTHAAAWNLIFFPWPLEEDTFTEGPFRGYQIYSRNEALLGYRIYQHRSSGYFRPEDIETHYQRKLVEEWWPREEGWERLDDLDASYNGWAWRRGRQVFLVVCANDDYVRSFQTYLLNR